ncbi:MAG: hypothetical protein ACYTAF_13820 [Planctomycetota bacterium]
MTEQLHILKKQFKEHHHGAVLISPTSEMSGEVVVNVTPPDEVWRGRSVLVGKLRGWLWKNRQRRSLQRSNAVLWAARSGGDTVVGVGALVAQRTADRYDRLHPDAEVING